MKCGENMKLNEINPFVRFAMPIYISGTTESVKSRDCRLFYVIEGTGSVMAGDDYEQEIFPGCTLIWQGGTPYSFSADEKLALMSVNFDYTQSAANVKSFMTVVSSESFSDDMKAENLSFEDCKALNRPLAVSGIGGMREKIFKLSDTFIKKELCYSERCSAILKDIIIDVIQCSLFSSASVLAEVERVVEYIHRNYAKDITNEEIAKTVNYHPHYLSRLMMKYTGMTLHKYLIGYRLEKAAELLINGNESVSYAAAECGFGSAYHLSNAFKEKYGCSPTEYRKKYKNMP